MRTSQKGGQTKMRKTLISLPEDTYKQLGHYSVETDLTMSEIVDKALKLFFKEGGEKKR